MEKGALEVVEDEEKMFRSFIVFQASELIEMVRISLGDASWAVQ